jgi:hypothetical protein
MRRLALILLLPLLASCAVGQGRQGQGPVAAGGSPSASCPPGWTYISQQAWVQADKDGNGRVDFPQTLPPGGGGHLHAEFCAPLGVRISGRQMLHVELMSHQGFAGSGDKVDVGLAPGGDSLGRADAPPMLCGPKPAKCHGHVAVPFDAPGGDANLRVRYLPAHLPNGERWFPGGELPVGNGSGDGFGGKSWLEDYANARARNWQELIGKPLSGTVNVDVFTKGDHIRTALVHVDARFGADDEGIEIAARSGEFRGIVPLDTTQLTNGYHCLAIRADAQAGPGRLQTGVIEFPIRVHNEGARAGNGTGACFPGVS